MRAFIRVATAVLALPLAAGAQPPTLGPAQQRAIIDKARLRFFAAGFEAMSVPQAPPPGFLNQCAGEYEEGRRLVMRDGVLYLVSGAVERRLTYMGDRTFMVDGRSDYRVKVQVEHDAVTQCQVLWCDETADTYKRTKQRIVSVGGGGLVSSPAGGLEADSPDHRRRRSAAAGARREDGGGACAGWGQPGVGDRLPADVRSSPRRACVRHGCRVR